MVGKINMKQLRRQEERAKKKQAMREMEEEQCTEYFEEPTKGGHAVSNAKGTKGERKGNEEKKQERKEEKEGLGTISWHGEEETDSITFPEDLKTAYETLKIKPSTSDEVVVEYLLDKVEHLSSAGHPEDIRADSLELGCILLVLCDRTTCFDSPYFTLLQFIFAVLANKHLESLRLPLPRSLDFDFPTPSILPKFSALSLDPLSITAKLSQILIVRQYPMVTKPPFKTEATFYLRYDPEHTEAVYQAINKANRSWAEDVTGTSSIKSIDEDLDKKIAELEKKNDALRSELNMNTKIASSNAAVAQLNKTSNGQTKVSSDVSNLKVELEKARYEASISRAEVKLLKEQGERNSIESKKMRERSRQQLSEKDEVIKGLRESNATLSKDLSITTAQSTSEDKLKTELADVKMQLREAQAKSTSFSDFKECISLQRKVSKELAIEVARLKDSSSGSTSTPSATDKKDFVISTLSKKVIDFSKQVKEQNEQLAEMMIIMSKSVDD